MNYKSYSDLNTDIRNHIQRISELNIDLVVGVPRSGMAPAYMISLLLNVHCTDIESFIENRPLTSGNTRRVRRELSTPFEAENVLIVDDSINTGNTMEEAVRKARSVFDKHIYALAVYSSKLMHDRVDVFLEFVSQPRVFEWNLFGHQVLKDSCLDIDGVLCVDPTEQQNDDGVLYRDFILNAKPRFLPSYTVFALVTSRLEKYRPETEQWLNKYKIKYDNLIMLDLPSQQERKKLRCYGDHKAGFYQRSGSVLFIESDPFQAKEICELSGKPVYCTDDNHMYMPGYMSLLVNDRINILDRLKGLYDSHFYPLLRESKKILFGVQKRNKR
ncbi:MAG: phosphoribosyltransferase [Moraxellaceae bacterium]|nr:MAG: phosphoribosyltransferase [Moraxellaceae bacterium]